MSHRLHLYDVVDKAPVVLDIGAYYTKCGFSGEGCPRAIFPTNLRTPSGLTLPWYVHLGESSPELIVYSDAFETLLQSIYYVHLQVTPSNRDVIVCENLFFPNAFRRILIHILFEKFHVPSLSFLPNQLLPLIPLQKKSALIVDVGHSQVTVLPVVEGYGVLKSMVSSQCGDAKVHEKILYGLESSARVVQGTQVNKRIFQGAILKELKVFPVHLGQIRIRLAHCPTEKPHLKQVRFFLEKYSKGPYPHPSEWPFQEDPSSPAAEPTPSVSSAPPVKRISKEDLLSFPLSIDSEFQFPKSVVEDAFDVLFNDPETSVCHLVLDAILKSDVDLRLTLIQNIVLVGGGFASPGVQKRFYFELARALVKDPAFSSISRLVYEVGILNLRPFRPESIAWVGGSISGATGKVKAMTIEEYKAISASTVGSNVKQFEIPMDSFPNWFTCVDDSGKKNGMRIFDEVKEDERY